MSWGTVQDDLGMFSPWHGGRGWGREAKSRAEDGGSANSTEAEAGFPVQAS